MKKLPTIILIAIVALLLCCIAILFLLAPIKGEVFSSIEEVSSLSEDAMSFQLTSTAFTQGNLIPAQYTCTGEDISPPLAWDEPPAGTQSLALIMDDPDAPAGTWVHWVIYNTPASAGSLPENVPPDAKLADGSLQGKNSWGKPGYGGPCPPSGTHRYFFKLYALDAVLTLASGVTKAELLTAMEGHILGYAELMGTYHK
ncbi:MAG: YbhB/YbcL family Raf kinase inhibitor-like protein [Anaerolineales bacterium]|nr:YbhB/YbcL family Raf kinase inhibitor-like protein [Anaerolineales bacterium]MDO9348116.1 YbhB/YbcL family Raf kinase inhibitor-like protein [Anaerolineales bacterium]MDP3186696.1 YbhB/YbcL family Raf kinase inhibitor-like protein [Anaerolineales bacterium]